MFCRSEVLRFSKKLSFCGDPVGVALILLLRNDLHCNVAVNLINRCVNVAEVATTNVITYHDICDVVIHCVRFQPKA